MTREGRTKQRQSQPATAAAVLNCHHRRLYSSGIILNHTQSHPIKSNPITGDRLPQPLLQVPLGPLPRLRHGRRNERLSGGVPSVPKEGAAPRSGDGVSAADEDGRRRPAGATRTSIVLSVCLRRSSHCCLLPLLRVPPAPGQVLPTQAQPNPHLLDVYPASTPQVAGSALFGVGWGLGGLCPGPAIADLSASAPPRWGLGVSGF